jgi:hypothetical protein
MIIVVVLVVGGGGGGVVGRETVVLADGFIFSFDSPLP